MGTLETQYAFETQYERLGARSHHRVCDSTDIIYAVLNKLLGWCKPIRCLVCMCITLVLLVFGVCFLCFFASSKTGCHPEHLERQEVPAGGNILPDQVWLETR